MYRKFYYINKYNSWRRLSSSNSAVATVNSNGVVSGASVGSVMITYTVTISGCSNASSYSLNVADGSNITAPSIAAQGSTGLCGNSTVQICPTVWGWNNYQWYQNGVAVTQNGTGACITVDTSKLGSYTLTATNSNGCWSPTSNAVVVAPASTPVTPVITDGGITSTCNGQPVSLTSSASTGNQWYKDGFAISGATSPTYAATASGVYNVKVTDNCGSVATSAGTSVTVTPYITLSSIQSIRATVCKSATLTLSNTTPGGLWSLNNTSVATVDAITGVVTGVDTGTVVITYTVSSGSCSNAVSATFTVVDGSNVVAPVIVAQSDSNICLNGNVTLCPTSFGLSNYQWYKNGIAIGQYGVGGCITVDTAALGRYTLTGTNGSGCLSAVSNSILVSTVSTAATPTVTVNGPASTCNGQPVSLTSSASTGNQWNKDGIAISGATGQTYQTAVTGVYTVTATNQCGSSATSNGISISVGPYITVNSIQSITGIVCKNATSTLINTTPGGVWTSNNINVGTVHPSTGLLTGIDTGTVTIAYTVTVNGCSNAVYATFTIVDGSSITPPTIVAQSSTTLCGTNTVQLCPTAYGWSNYQWYKNGVAVTTNGSSACIVIDTAKLGSYTLSATTGTCWSSQSNAIAVTTSSAPAIPTISASGSTSICSGSSVTLTSSSASGNQWKKDGNIISGATSQTYAATTSGVYTVTVTNCGSTSSTGTTVTVASPINVASITNNGSSTVCFGNNISLSCATSGGVWSSSDASIATVNASGVVTTVSAGTVTISYTITSGACTGVSTYTLVVQNGTVTTPVIAATGGATTGSTAICGSGSLQMCPQVWGYSNYQWYKDGVAYSTSACIKVNTAGSYTLKGTNGSGCWSAQSAPANVTLNPIPTMVATTGPTAVCAGSTITLTNSTSIPSGGTGVWTTGYTSQVSVGATTGIVSALNAGNVVIKYTVTSAVGCTNFTNYNVTINAIPGVPSITYAPGTVGNPQAGAPTGSFCANRTFTVVGTPSGGVWSKTGPITVTTPAGLVTTGSVAGSGSIKYTYTDANGCSNSRTMVGSVYVCAARGIANTNDPLTISNDFTMYPNPAKGFINLNVETLIGAGSIVVTDLYGKAVKTQSLSMGTNNININKLAAGMYFVSVITTEGKTTKKLVVE